MDEEEEDTLSEEIDNISANFVEELHIEEKEINFTPPTFLPLSGFNKNIIKCILNECTDQLYILRNINSQDNTNFIGKTIEYASIADRYVIIMTLID